MTQGRHKRQDTVSPTVNGYMRIPAIWVGEQPPPDQVRMLNPAIHHETVMRKKLKCGIQARVQRDGLFLFDFSDWDRAPSVVIPGFDVPEQTGSMGVQVPKAHVEAHSQAAAIIVLRAKIMNVHQACFTTAERTVRNRSAMMGFPVHSREMHHSINIEHPLYYQHNIELPRSLAENVLNNAYGINFPKPASRRIIELDVVERSLDFLDEILMHENLQLVDIIEAFYIASIRGRETRLGEALTIAWAACEQLISIAWARLLEDAGSHQDSAPMNKDRRKKFNGRDYTSSVKVEILQLQHKIDARLYAMLETARKARNRWAHDLTPPSPKETSSALNGLERLLEHVVGLKFKLQTSAEEGAFPQWSASALQQTE